MKNILIIGLGQFGKKLASNLAELGNQLMAVDINEEAMTPVLPLLTAARVGDCTDAEVIHSLDIKSFDICFVCIGDRTFQAAMEITALLKEAGAATVVAKANKDLHARLLLRIGADEVVFPDQVAAERAAVKYSSVRVFDYIELEAGFSIYEIEPLEEWVGRTLKDVQLAEQYHVNVIGMKEPTGRLTMMPAADTVLSPERHLLVLGHRDDITRIISKFKD